MKTIIHNIIESTTAPAPIQKALETDRDTIKRPSGTPNETPTIMPPIRSNVMIESQALQRPSSDGNTGDKYSKNKRGAKNVREMNRAPAIRLALIK